MGTVLLLLGIGGIFTAILLALIALGVVGSEERGVNRSLAVLDAFSSAPQELKQELEPSFNDRVLNPLMDRFQGLGHKLTPADLNDRMRHKLELAGNPPGWTIERITSMKFLGFIAALFLSLTFTTIIGTPFLVTLVLVVGASLAGYMSPNLYIYQLGYNRTEQISKAIPDAIDLLTISVESGLGFDAALSQVARNTDGPLAGEFSRVLQEMQIGLGRSAALRALGDRSSVPELKGFVSAMVQADALGIGVAQVLRVQSREIRVKRRQKAEEKAQKVAVKILIPLIFCILPCLFIAVLGPAAIGIIDAFSGRV